MDVCPSSTSKPQEKHKFQFAYRLMMLEYIGAVLRGAFCCANGATPPPQPPPMGGSPPLPLRPMKFAKGVRPWRLVLARSLRPHPPYLLLIEE